MLHFATALLLGALALFSFCARAADVIQNGSFENGLTGWTAVIQPDGAFETDVPWTADSAGNGTFELDGAPFSTQPLQGLNDAFNGFDGSSGLISDLYQEVQIPALSLAQLVTHHRVVFEQLPSSEDADRVFRISVRDTSGNLLQDLHQESINGFGAAGVVDRGWVTGDFPLSQYAGQTVRVFFSYQVPDDSFLLGRASLELDAISLEVTPVPEPATTVLLVAGLAALGVVARRRRASLS